MHVIFSAYSLRILSVFSPYSLCIPTVFLHVVFSPYSYRILSVFLPYSLRIQVGSCTKSHFNDLCTANAVAYPVATG